jgi:hypothetical protein
MTRLWTIALAGLVAAAPPVPEARPKGPLAASGRLPAWIEDCAAQLLARTLVDETRTRLGRPIPGAAGPDVADAPIPVPDARDLARASARIQDTIDELFLLSGLTPLPRPARPAGPASPVDRRTPGAPVVGARAATAGGPRDRARESASRSLRADARPARALQLY